MARSLEGAACRGCRLHRGVLSRLRNEGVGVVTREHLRVVSADEPGHGTTGEDVLERWTAMSARFLSQQLVGLPLSDPWRGEIQALADRYVRLTERLTLQPL